MPPSPPPLPAFSPIAPAVLPRLWRTLTHPLWLILLLILIAPAIAAHLWLPQAPTLLAGDTLARDAWLNETTSSIPAGGLLGALGLLDVTHSTLLALLICLLAVALLLRLYDRLHLAWATRHLAPPDRWLPHLNTLTHIQTDPTPSALWQHDLPPLLSRWQTAPEKAAPEIESCGDRHQYFNWPAALIEGGLILALCVFVLDLRTGWQIDPISLNPGDTASLAPFSSNTLSLDADAASLHLCCRPDQITPLTAAGMGGWSLRGRIQQIGSALALAATTNGQEVVLQAVEQSGAPTANLILRFPQPRSERAVAIPDRNLFLRLVAAEQGGFNLQALDAANNLLLAQTITDDTQIALGDLTLTLHPTHFVTLSLSSRPWLWLLLPTLLLTLAGLLCRWRFPYVRVGVRQNADGIAMRWQGQTGARPTITEINALISAHN